MIENIDRLKHQNLHNVGIYTFTENEYQSFTITCYTFHFWENSQNHNLMNKVCQHVICDLHLRRHLLSELIRLFINQL
jgi:hypothetical protein